MNLKRVIIKEFHDFHWGTFLASKIQFLLTLAVFFGVYEIRLVYKIIGTITAVVIIWFTGKIWRIYFKEEFQKENFKGSLTEKQKDL